MLYFETLPKILTPDQNGKYILLTNLMARGALVEDLQNNPMLFYKYSMQDGDTPEIIAEKYYSDPYKYWIVLYSNQILDPLWEWPLPYNQFSGYIANKYTTEAEAENKTPLEYTQTTIYRYEKITKTKDSYSENVTETVSPVSFTEYSSLTPSNNTYDLPSGLKCEVDISKRAVTIYDYEYEKNEARREIKIMDSAYASQMEQQLKAIMGS